MKTDGMTEVLPLNKKQKAICTAVMGVLLVAAGIVIILTATGVIDAPISAVVAPTILFAVGSAMTVSAIIAKNSISMWIAGVVLACGLASLLVGVTGATYANVYPIYIASPGIGCCLSVWFAEAKFPPVKVALFFGGLAAVFALNSSGTCGWGLTGGILAAFLGVCVILYVIVSFLKKDKNNA